MTEPVPRFPSVPVRVPSISVSTVRAWLVCPRQYAFASVERLEPEHESAARSFGIAVHETLAWFSIPGLHAEPPSPSDTAEHFRARWNVPLTMPRLYAPGTSFHRYATQGEALVALYAERFAHAPVASSETPFRVPIAEHLALAGRFDLLRPQHTLVELKTAARAPRDTSRHRLQLAAYSLAYRRLHGVRPRIELVTLVASASPEIVVQALRIAPEDETLFTATAVEIERAIKLRVFPPNPGWACASCPYTRACRASNDVHATIAVEPGVVAA